MAKLAVVVLAIILGLLFATHQASGSAAGETTESLQLGAEETELEGEVHALGGVAGEGASAPPSQPEESLGGRWGDSVSARSPQGRGARPQSSAVAQYKPKVPAVLSEYVARSGVLLSNLIVAVVSKGGDFARWVKQILSHINEDGFDLNKQVGPLLAHSHSLPCPHTPTVTRHGSGA